MCKYISGAQLEIATIFAAGLRNWGLAFIQDIANGKREWFLFVPLSALLALLSTLVHFFFWTELKP